MVEYIILQEWLEALCRRQQPAKWMDRTEKKTTSEEKDNEKRRDKEEVGWRDGLSARTH